jgi:hypothetical protein
MHPPAAVVVTSIASPNRVLRMLAQQCAGRGLFIVIRDSASPSDFTLEGCRFLGIADQLATGFELARRCPLRHYARKNLGYLIAVAQGAQLINVTDDDNFPCDSFWGAGRGQYGFLAPIKLEHVNLSFA